MNLEAVVKKLKDSNELLEMVNEVLKVEGNSALTQTIDAHLEGCKRYENSFNNDISDYSDYRGNG